MFVAVIDEKYSKILTETSMNGMLRELKGKLLTAALLNLFSKTTA